MLSPFEKIGIFTDHKSLCSALDKLYIRIAESSIVEEEEGSVLYITEKNKKNANNPFIDKILVLSKLKNS